MTTVVRKLRVGYNMLPRTWAAIGYDMGNYGPGAVRYGNKIYYAYQGSGYDAYAVYYNGSTWSDAVYVGAGPLSEGHGAATMARSLDGKLHVFFGCHDTQCQYATSTSADDISAWTDTTSKISGGSKALDCTYPMAFVDPSSGYMYLFFRHTVADPNDYCFSYMKSTDNGVTWSDRVDFIDETARNYWIYPVENGQYVTYIDGQWCIELNWCLRVEAYGVGEGRREHQFYVRFGMSDNKFYALDGTTWTDLGTTITTTEEDTYCKTYDTTGYWCHGTTMYRVGTQNEIPIQVLQMEYGSDVYRHRTRTYNKANKTWENVCDLDTFTPNSQWMGSVLFDYGGKTLLIINTDGSVGSEPANGGLKMYEYNWNNNSWINRGYLISRQGARTSGTDAAYFRHMLWSGTIPTENPTMHFMDVGASGGLNATHVATIDSNGELKLVSPGTNLETTGINVNQQTANFIIMLNKGTYHAINCTTGKIDYSGTYKSVWDSAIAAMPSKSGIIVDKTMGNGEARNIRYLGGVQTNVSTNLLSAAFAIDSATTVTVTTAHNLPVMPPIQGIAVTVIENTVVDDWVCAYAKVTSVDETNITCKVKITTASATSGATAKLGLKVDIR